MPEAYDMKGAPLLRLNVEGPNGRLVLSGASDAESRSWYEFEAEWVADLCGLTLGVPSPVIRTRGCLPRAG